MPLTRTLPPDSGDFHRIAEVGPDFVKSSHNLELFRNRGRPPDGAVTGRLGTARRIGASTFVSTDNTIVSSRSLRNLGQFYPFPIAKFEAAFDRTQIRAA